MSLGKTEESSKTLTVTRATLLMEDELHKSPGRENELRKFTWNTGNSERYQNEERESGGGGQMQRNK